MRTITKAALALGFVGAMLIGDPRPSSAQGIYFGAPGVEVDVGRPAYRQRYYRQRSYDDGAYAYAPRRYGRWNTFNGCPPRYTIQDGVCKPYRGY
jgi:hypothetical protein